MKAVSFIALALSLAGALVAYGAYARVRTHAPGTPNSSSEIEALKARIARLESDVPSGDRKPTANHAHGTTGDATHAPPSDEVAALRKRVDALERQITAGRMTQGDPGRTARPNPAIVETMKKRLTDPTQQLRARAQAIGALRMQGAHKTDDVIDAALSLLPHAATDATLRALILRNLQGAENAKLVSPLIEILKADGDEDVRDEAAKVLGEYVSRPEVKTALEQAAANDQSEKVKRRAQAALAAKPK